MFYLRGLEARSDPLRYLSLLVSKPFEKYRCDAVDTDVGKPRLRRPFRLQRSCSRNHLRVWLELVRVGSFLFDESTILRQYSLF